MGMVIAVCISEKRGTKKTQVPYIDLLVNHGIIGDAHAGKWHRQVSLLAQESIDKMLSLGLDLKAGDFAENIVTSGIDLKTLPIGTVLSVGETKLRVTQIGKKCHSDCEIKKLTGKCVMPTEGIFAEVITGGRIKADDEIAVCGDIDETDKN
ncbi:MAG: MOSC domain-containing protein [Ruminococcus sp.]|nr:MOSC domain-containing protein [Ruminococcus sp.]